jgi:hypothetical protein
VLAVIIRIQKKVEDRELFLKLVTVSLDAAFPCSSLVVKAPLVGDERVLSRGFSVSFTWI